MHHNISVFLFSLLLSKVMSIKIKIKEINIIMSNLQTIGELDLDIEKQLNEILEKIDNANKTLIASQIEEIESHESDYIRPGI